MTEHEDWIRYYSFVQAKDCNRYAPVEKIINEATKISAFVMGKPRAEILKLATPQPEEEIES